MATATELLRKVGGELSTAPGLEAPTFELLNVIDLSAVSAEPPAMLVERHLVRGHAHLIYGEKEGGKTWYSLAAHVKPMLDVGGVVMWIDREMDATSIRSRLDALGVTDFRNFKYLNSPLLTDLADARRQWAAFLQQAAPALVVCDAQAGVLAAAGLNEDRTGDVLKWDSWYLAPARALGATTVMLDHVGHEEKGRARGAYGKGAAAKVELLVETVTSFDREKVGRIRVTRKKNTLAAPIPEMQTFRIGGSDPFLFADASVLDLLEPGEAATRAATFHRVVTDCRAAIELHPDGLTVTQVRGLVQGKATMIADALAKLHADPDVPVRGEPGNNRSVIYRWTGGEA